MSRPLPGRHITQEHVIRGIRRPETGAGLEFVIAGHAYATFTYASREEICTVQLCDKYSGIKRVPDAEHKPSDLFVWCYTSARMYPFPEMESSFKRHALELYEMCGMFDLYPGNIPWWVEAWADEGLVDIVAECFRRFGCNASRSLISITKGILHLKGRQSIDPELDDLLRIANARTDLVPWFRSVLDDDHEPPCHAVRRSINRGDNVSGELWTSGSVYWLLDVDAAAAGFATHTAFETMTGRPDIAHTIARFLARRAKPSKVRAHAALMKASGMCPPLSLF